MKKKKFVQPKQMNETLRAAKLKAAEEGHHNGPAPIGYRFENGGLQIVPEEAEIVRCIYAMARKGCGLSKIVNELNAFGYRTRCGAEWSVFAVRAILTNRVYFGEVQYCGHWYPGRHKAIIK